MHDEVRLRDIIANSIVVPVYEEDDIYEQDPQQVFSLNFPFSLSILILSFSFEVHDQNACFTRNVSHCLMNVPFSKFMQAYGAYTVLNLLNPELHCGHY